VQAHTVSRLDLLNQPLLGPFNGITPTKLIRDRPQGSAIGRLRRGGKGGACSLEGRAESARSLSPEPCGRHRPIPPWRPCSGPS